MTVALFVESCLLRTIFRGDGDVVSSPWWVCGAEMSKVVRLRNEKNPSTRGGTTVRYPCSIMLWHNLVERNLEFGEGDRLRCQTLSSNRTRADVFFPSQRQMPSPSTYIALEEAEDYRDEGRASRRSSDRKSSNRTSERRRSLSDPAWTDEFAEDYGPNGEPPAALPEVPNEFEMRKAAALCVQRWYRKQVLKYGTFGPMIFTRKDGKISDFGRLTFSTGNRSAQFMRVADTTSAATLSHFLEKYWKLRRPDVLISVTGSAASLTLTSQLQRVFDRGLAQAAAMTNAWIFTGGTDSGVMKLVGEAMHKGGECYGTPTGPLPVLLALP